jgi:prepilin-type N-terminal cleavage/methylation domain-containing protein
MNQMGMKKKNGFTLVELIVVISIVGVLMAFVLPSISGVLERSRKSNAQNCLKQIVNAYLMYREDKGDIDPSTPLVTDGWGKETVRNIKLFAMLMAQEGLLNDAHSYIFPSDSLAKSKNTVQKDMIVHADGVTYADCWSSDADSEGFSINIVLGLSNNCQSNTTPIAFTRGLKSDGTWDETSGVFGKKGGFVAFLDGRVKWFDNVTGKLMKADMTDTTSNLREAIPAGATIIGGGGEVNF